MPRLARLIAIVALPMSVACGDGPGADGLGAGGDAGTDAIADAAGAGPDGTMDAAGASAEAGRESSAGDEPCVEGMVGCTPHNLAEDASADVLAIDSDLPACAADGGCAAGSFCWSESCVRVERIVPGALFTCALLTGGAVQCWGANSDSQLGNNSTTDSPVPVAVEGLPGGITAVAAGAAYACALTADGTVLCWGSNDSGQLGMDSALSSAPVAVAGLPAGVVAITAGRGHTCALTAGGAVLCWGSNDSGQLGNNSTTDSPTPVEVAGLPAGVTAIGAGSEHTCALTTGGAVLCWGNDGYGQLGNGSTTNNSALPVGVSGLSSGIAAISAGYTATCALTTGGAVLCWGSDGNGELGNDMTTLRSPVPVAVSGLSSGVAAVAAGESQACVLTTSGGMQCWGINGLGELGADATGGSSSVPVAVSGLTSGVAAIASGGSQNCALTTGGAALCWGNNGDGQVGDGTTTNRSVPVRVVEP